MTTPLPDDYAERVYAGVLGKVIGVYLGRPFEGWSYERIQQQLGDIEYYVHDKLGVPLIVTDDDISGTFTFLRALGDNGYREDLSAREIGESWLNYLIENRTILWWGGLGNSTEHTAYLRLKDGVPAPESGSMARNGQVVAEQIGAQIFIDGWAMVAPGDPDLAVRLAREAARVSHDGEAVHGAVVLAALEAMAFEEQDIDVLLDRALGYIPGDSTIRRLIDDLRAWHSQEPDWRATRERLAGSYGYDRYGGNCHMVPNHGLIIHALLHGAGDFSESLKIINTCGWDTDCNSGNLGCLLGIMHGLDGISAGPRDWREPVADRIYLPTADPTWGISDCLREAQEVVSAGRRLKGLEPWAPCDGAQFHFSLPGAVQGFQVVDGNGSVANRATDTGGYLALTSAGPARFATPVFAPSKDVAKFFEKGGYALLASPRVYPGQTLACRVAEGSGRGCLFLRYYGENDAPVIVRGEGVDFTGSEAPLELVVPEEAAPVFEIGIEVDGAASLLVDWLRWDGEPSVTLSRPPHKGTMWRRAWVNGVDDFARWWEPYRLMQNQGRGLLIQGTRDWANYEVRADVTPHLASAAGIAARVQGMRRYYALLLVPGRLELRRVLGDETVLASCPLDWQLGERQQLALRVDGPRLTATLNGTEVLSAEDKALSSGAVALVIEEGRTATEAVTVVPLR